MSLLNPPYFPSPPEQTITSREFISYLATLPTSDPHVLNAPWNNNGVLTISTG